MTKPKHFRKIALALCLPIFIACVDVMALSIGLSSIMHEFGTDLKNAQWIFSSYMLATGATLIFFGQLSDLYDSNKILIIGVSLFSFSSALAGFSFNFCLLIIARIIQGIACSIITTSSITTIKKKFSANVSTILYSRWVTAVGLGLSLGPIIGAIAINNLNWRYIYLINIPIGMIAIINLNKYILHVSKTTANLSQLTNSLPFVFFIFASGLILFLFDNNIIYSIKETSITLLTLVILINLIYYKKNNNTTLLNFKILKSKIFISALIGSFFSYFFMYAWLYTYSLYLQTCVNLTPILSGLLTTPYSFSFAYTPILISSFFPNVKTIDLLKIGVLISATAFFLLFKITINQLSMIHLVFATSLLGASIAMINFSTIKLYTDIMPNNSFGAASGFLFTIRWLGGATGVIFITHLIFKINTINNLKPNIILHDINTKTISISFLILACIAIFSFILINSQLNRKTQVELWS